ncbi:myb family protein [Schizosaccharomyces japonicus yFS275]|uniref:Myb family protein n=1 Tax=Schizosaccharomyces japonicus (strain yFS275 / FY16936) TaxID=402676 RepID=B6JZ90_SCHJY|nr:myb family protein [Schizosaccharomyces japonicus yFS275]EEB06858.1 myb family protein [Schizosaccharomyces japonicus yFS275]
MDSNLEDGLSGTFPRNPRPLDFLTGALAANTTKLDENVELQSRIEAVHSGRTRKPRVKWSEEETNNLLQGCRVHGVGNWKKILTDERFHFSNRSPNDLKDRFRTIFPEEYRKLYPNAKTHTGRQQKIALTSGFSKKTRKERQQFTPEEDERLLEGFFLHGPCWTRIRKDASLGLQTRRSTDLRDRFRNAFPERYAAAGFKLKNNRKLKSLQTDSMLVSNGANGPSSSLTTSAAAAAVAAVASTAAATAGSFLPPAASTSTAPSASPSPAAASARELSGATATAATLNDADELDLGWSSQSLPSQLFHSQRVSDTTNNLLLGSQMNDPFASATLGTFHNYEQMFPPPPSHVSALTAPANTPGAAQSRSTSAYTLLQHTLPAHPPDSADALGLTDSSRNASRQGSHLHLSSDSSPWDDRD